MAEGSDPESFQATSRRSEHPYSERSDERRAHHFILVADGGSLWSLKLFVVLLASSLEGGFRKGQRQRWVSEGVDALVAPRLTDIFANKVNTT